MKRRRFNVKIMWAASIVGMLAGIFGVANSEESSILQGATMIDNGELYTSISNRPALANSPIAGNYKVETLLNSINSNNGKKEFVFEVHEAK